jgi:hypothetical protein
VPSHINLQQCYVLYLNWWIKLGRNHTFMWPTCLNPACNPCALNLPPQNGGTEGLVEYQLKMLCPKTVLECQIWVSHSASSCRCLLQIRRWHPCRQPPYVCSVCWLNILVQSNPSAVKAKRVPFVDKNVVLEWHELFVYCRLVQYQIEMVCTNNAPNMLLWDNCGMVKDPITERLKKRS